MSRSGEIVRDYFRAMNDGANPERVRAFYADDIQQIEYPNRFTPEGATRDAKALREAAERGAKVMSKQTYDVKRLIAEGDHVAVEFVWRGTLAVAVGNLKIGDEMKGHFATFIELKDGKIVKQSNYDCFEPF